MGSRSIIVIFVIGIVGLASLGFMTKYVFEGDQGLQKVARFKAGLLEKYAHRGIEGVSYRRIRSPRGVSLLLVARQGSISEADGLHEEIAEYYVEKFPRAIDSLKLAYREKARWGCGTPEPFLKKEFSIGNVRIAVEDRRKRDRLASSLKALGGLDLIEARQLPGELRVLAAWNRKENEKTIGEEGVSVNRDRLLQATARAAASALRPSRKDRIHVVFVDPNSVRSSGGGVPPEPPAARENQAGSTAGETRGPPGRGESEASSSQGPPILAQGIFDLRGRRIRTP